MTSGKLDRLLGRKPRQPESPLTQDDMNLAASIQHVTEEVMLKSARHLHEQTGLKNLCLAGGVALKCVGVGRVLRETPFQDVWVQPASGDAGGALGVAMLIWHQLLGNARKPSVSDGQYGSRLGPKVTSDCARKAIDDSSLEYERVDSDQELCARVSNMLADGKVVGWMQGRMEFGPRALGGRSILGDPRNPAMQSVMNLKIKFRESFRPFAPSVLQEHVHEYFETRHCEDAPYMTIVAMVVDHKRQEPTRGLDGLERLGDTLSEVPAITHIDYSARVQTVDERRSGRYYKLLKNFYELTGCPLVINTSFNVRGEPIVCTAADAVRCFLATGMDALVIENYIALKNDKSPQPELTAKHVSQFLLD